MVAVVGDDVSVVVVASVVVTVVDVGIVVVVAAVAAVVATVDAVVVIISSSVVGFSVLAEVLDVDQGIVSSADFVNNDVVTLLSVAKGVVSLGIIGIDVLLSE